MRLNFRISASLVRGGTIPLALIVSTLMGISARADFIIGGFDASRGGDYSFPNGSAAGGLRSLVALDFPSATITSSPTLTSTYLSSINVLVIDAVYTGNDVPIIPLSSSEQTALVNFVHNGGSAILISDNSSYKTASNSFNSPFGVTVTGFLGGSQAGTVINTANPVTNGPFGLATGFTGSYAGYYSSLGTYATSLATFNTNGAPGVAVIGRGALAPGSGAVVFFSDSFPIDNLTGNPNNQSLILNAIAYASPTAAVPEPSSLTLSGTAVLIGAAYCRRRASGRGSKS